jgi:hypothetical protein
MATPAKITFHTLSDQSIVIEAHINLSNSAPELANGFNRRGKFYALNDQLYWEDFNVELNWIQRYNQLHGTNFVSYKEIRLAMEWKDWEAFKHAYIIANFPTLVHSYQEMIQVDEKEFTSGIALAMSIKVNS